MVQVLVVFLVLLISVASDMIEPKFKGALIGDKIVGGVEIPLAIAPYMAQLEVALNSTHLVTCGGSIISIYTILTAAHCVFPFTASQVKVRVGSDLNRGGELFRALTLKTHPKYDPKLQIFDLSLIILASPITLVIGRKEIVRLAAQNEAVADGTMLLVSGWG
jgi:secreted trypsin-like serine protease